MKKIDGEFSKYFPESCFVTKLEKGATGIVCGYCNVNNKKAKLLILRCYIKESCIMEIDMDLWLAKNIYDVMKDKKVIIREHDMMPELI